jgi:MATE family multidrug resistance protein
MFDREGLVLFLKLGVPGVLLMSEWWASEFIVLAAGKLRNPSVAISAMSIYQATNAFAFMVAVGFGAATATRVSNEVGAKDASRAKLAASVALRLIVVVEVAVSATVYLSRERWGAAFTSDHDVRALVSKLMVPLAFYVFFDAVCCVSTSVLRGAGRQAFATPIVLFAYYVVGLPLSAWLAYKGYGAMGLAIGGVVGTATHAGIMTRVALCIDWPTEIARSKHIRGASAVDDDADDLASRLLVDVAADDDDGNAVDVLI